ncbi:hypothetical protein [Sphingomonas sp. NPDC079357]|uniref:hypothetical protein n=1 Tax=Sphingomonas sp. NPDC079357 TaxID=3364518 RepID=UPI00384F1B7B
MRISNLERKLARLCGRLERFDWVATVTLAGGLLTRLGLHPNNVQIEVLTHLAALHCNGERSPTAANVREWLAMIRSHVGHLEDPIEDVFVENVVGWMGNARVFRGLSESEGQHLQTALAATDGLQAAGHDWAGHLRRQFSALLNMSEAVAARADVPRNTLSEGTHRTSIAVTARSLDEAGSVVRFDRDELADLGIHSFDLRPFEFKAGDASGLAGETVGRSGLDRRPVHLDTDGGAVLIYPTAVSFAVRWRLLDTAVVNGAVADLAELVEGYQVAAVWKAALAWWRIVPDDVGLTADPAGVTTFSGSIDVGTPVDVVIIHDDLTEAHSKGLFDMRRVPRTIAALAARRANELATASDYASGLTIMVHGGLGRGFVVEIGEVPDGWQVIGMGIDDFTLLSRDPGFSCMRVKRMLDNQSALAAGGVEFLNFNGFANIYAWIRSLGFSPLPDEADPTSAVVYMGTDNAALMRASLRQVIDRHVVRAPEAGRWIEVERRSADAYFPETLLTPEYTATDFEFSLEPSGCVEVGDRVWWMTGKRRSPGDRTSLSYRVWDMARSWMLPVATRLDPMLRDLPETLVFALDVQTDDVPINSPKPSLDAAGRPVVRLRNGAVELGCALDYLQSFRLADNVGDRRMVEALVKGAFLLAGRPFAAGEIERIANDIVGGDVARFLHITAPQYAAQALLLGAPIDPPRFVAADVYAPMQIGLAGLSGRPLPKKLPERLRGKDATNLIEDVVDALWARIKDRLLGLDREAFIVRCLENHDALQRDRYQSRLTAAAVLALHTRRDDVVEASVRREGERALASLASRVLVEMAVCTSPVTGGSACSDAVFDELVAQASTLVEIAGRSDEIHYGFSDEGLLIHPNGSIELPSRFREQVQTPFLAAHGSAQFELAATSYSTLVQPLGDDEAEDLNVTGDAVVDAPEPLGEFETAFVVEFGMTPLTYVQLTEALAGFALPGSTVARVKRADLVRVLQDLGPMSAEEASVALGRVTLMPRKRWDEGKPKDAAPRDWWPWRYARRLSLLMRPLVQLSGGVDAVCLASVPLAHEAWRYAMRAAAGHLPQTVFRSEAMHSWVGGVIDRIGHAFNKEVRDALAGVGWDARSDIGMSELGGATAANGDVDVVAWRPSTGMVLLIECKRLMMDKTAGEIAERLQEYGPEFVDEKGNPGPLRKHLARIEIISRHVDQLARLTGIPEDRIRMVNCLVTAEKVPMQFHDAWLGRVDVVSDLDAFVAAAPDARFGTDGKRRPGAATKAR